MKHHLCLLNLLTAVAAHAGPRNSASYSITTDATDVGETWTTSTNYTNDGSAGGSAGLSTAAMPPQTTKSGYTGQFYDVAGLTITSGASTVNEGGTLQLAAWQALGDATFLAVPASSVAWSVQSGPLAGISAVGLATADVVYEDTEATAQGDFGGFTGLFNLTVLDSIADNFGSHAGDGLGDDWQVQYFGLDNPLAVPGVITDGSGLTNQFKYTVGLVPNNAASTFVITRTPVTGQPDQHTISYGPAFADRIYTLQVSTDLFTWDTLSGPAAGNGGRVSVTDSGANGQRRFYRVDVTRP